jgi:hypothetical protein
MAMHRLTPVHINGAAFSNGSEAGSRKVCFDSIAYLEFTLCFWANFDDCADVLMG